MLRRSPLVLLLIAVIALVVGGACGSTNDASSGPSPSAAAQGYPKVLKSEFGETTLNKRPIRVAVATSNTVDTDTLFALGTVPVLAPSTISRSAWLTQDQRDSIEKVWPAQATAGVDAETVASARPDLIVALSANRNFSQGDYDKLSRIAPVMFARVGELGWKDITTRLGEVLGLEQKARSLISSVDAKVNSVAVAHPQFKGKSAAHLLVYAAQNGGVTYGSQPGTDTAALFASLGFVSPPDASRYPQSAPLSEELLSAIQADFLLVDLTVPKDQAGFLLDSPSYKSIPAVAQGHVAVNGLEPGEKTNSFAWGLSHQSALATGWLVERLANLAGEVVR